MGALKDVITQELENFNEEQLKQIALFIVFLKFRTRYGNLQTDESPRRLYGKPGTTCTRN